MKPVTVINVFTVQDGKLNEFIEKQNAFVKELSQSVKGLIGGCMYKSMDGKSAVLVSTFESKQAQETIVNLQMFKDHISRIRSILVESKPGLYEEAYRTGQMASQ